jgi:DNA-binding transcriptional regulator YiaG
MGNRYQDIQQEQGISPKNIREIDHCKIAEIRKQYGVSSGRVATVY